MSTLVVCHPGPVSREKADALKARLEAELGVKAIILAGVSAAVLVDMPGPPAAAGGPEEDRGEGRADVRPGADRCADQ